ncbi:MAG: V-type ATPase subunit [Phycisphaerae bacterium]|nr:V-type ATPase subunit [Phycisphaerae bacterium]
MEELYNKIQFHFTTYPPPGEEDWDYAFATARVKSLEDMLTRVTLLNMANAPDYDQAAEMLSSTEYAISPSDRAFEQVSQMLLDKRTEARNLFKSLVEKPIADFILAREDFTNLRLALRRKLADKPIGTDYNNDGCVEAELFEHVLEEENYEPLPMHMREAIEDAVLAYYQDKDIRRIDHAIDRYEVVHGMKVAEKLGSTFILEFFRMKVDLTNIRTMLRLKFTDSDQRNVFLHGGYIEFDRLKHCIDLSYDAIAPLFYATPYFHVIESGIHYLAAKKSFLKLQSNCDKHLAGYLKSTSQLAAGPQPVIAYLLLKEAEIRNLRLILTAKINQLDKQLIIDSLGL